MWQSFSRFLIRSDLTLENVEPDDLELFLAGITPKEGSASDAVEPRYAWRALDLINKVLQHHAYANGTPANLAAATLLGSDRFRYVNARSREPLPETLSPKVARDLVQKLSVKPEELGLKPTWKVERDRTCLALMLGSGLTPMEIRLVTTDALHFDKDRHPSTPWKIRVPPCGKTVEHDAPIANWARRALKRWLTVRSDLGLEGSQLFSATRKSSEWTDVGCQRACTAMLIALIGEEYKYGGLMRLRHTFVIRQLARGTDLEKIGLWLGIRDLDRLQRYRRVMSRDEIAV